MPDKEKLLEEYRERIIEDEDILKEVRADRALLEEIRYRILSKKLHNQLISLVEDAIDNDKVQINSIEDLQALVELELLLS